MSWRCGTCGLCNGNDRQECQACFTNNELIESDESVSFHDWYDGKYSAEEKINYTLLKSPPFDLMDTHNLKSILYSHCKTTNKQYIIFYIRCQYEGKIKIYQYDIQINEYCKLSECPSLLQVSDQRGGVVLNSDTNEIYIFVNKTRLFATFNIDNKKWKIISHIKRDQKRSNFVQVFYIPSPVKQFLFYESGANKWKKFKQTAKNELVYMNMGDLVNISGGKLIHVPALKMVLLLSGSLPEPADKEQIYLDDWELYADTINQQLFYINTDKMNNNREQWRRYKGLRLPKKKYRIEGAFVVFDYILIVFMKDALDSCHDVKRGKEIWFLDLLFTNKWYKWTGKYLYGLRYSPDYHFVTQDGDIYGVRTFMSYNKHLIKFNVSELIPYQLKKLYIPRFNKAVVGYIRMKIENKYKMIVPADLKQTIIAYFSPL